MLNYKQVGETIQLHLLIQLQGYKADTLTSTNRMATSTFLTNSILNDATLSTGGVGNPTMNPNTNTAAVSINTPKIWLNL